MAEETIRLSTEYMLELSFVQDFWYDYNLKGFNPILCLDAIGLLSITFANKITKSMFFPLRYTQKYLNHFTQIPSMDNL